MNEAPRLSRDMLDRFEGLLRVHDAPLSELLRPGLSTEQMDEITTTIGLRLPVEARTWWGWHDGAESQENERLRDFGPGILLSLDEAVQRWRMRRQVAIDCAEGEDDRWGDPDFYWRPEWFPVASRGADVVCDCSVPDGAITPLRVIDSHADPEASAIVEASSFGEMVTWWIEALEANAYRYDHQAALWRRDDSLITDDRLSTRLV